MARGCWQRGDKMLALVKCGGGAGLCCCLLSHRRTSCLPCRSAAMAGARETEAGAWCCAPCTLVGTSPGEVQKHHWGGKQHPARRALLTPPCPFPSPLQLPGPPPPLLQPLSHPGLPGTSQLKISQAGARRVEAKFPAWLRSLSHRGFSGSWTTAGVMLTHAVPQFPHPEAKPPLGWAVSRT